MTARGLLGIAVLLFAGCGGDDGSADADADTDSDTDTDTGSDADSDSDTGTGSDADTLHVVVTGAGTGRVTSDLGDVDCTSDGGTCDAAFDAGTDVALTATAEPGFVFAGYYDGACTGGGPCTVRVDGDVTVRAAFVPVLFQSSRATDGSDAVDPDGIYRLWSVRTDGTNVQPIAGLVEAGVETMNGSWSPDGDRIAYVRRELGGSLQAAIANADGTGASLLQDLALVTSYEVSFSPDGSRVVFVSNGELTGANEALDSRNLWIANADGSGLDPVTTFGVATVADAHFSPDGTKILFSSNAGFEATDVPVSSMNLWVIGVDGSDPTPLTRYTSGAWFYPRSEGGWSPDGQWIVCASTAALDGSDAVNASPNLWVVRADGSEKIPLTSYTDFDIYPDDPRWSPDGTRILFASAGALDGSDVPMPSGAYNLWVVGADGTGLSHITQNTVAAHYSGDWSADGTQIVHETNLTLEGGLGVNDNGTFNIWISNADGTRADPLTTIRAAGADAGYPEW